MTEPRYGVSGHYLGDQGKEYFSRHIGALTFQLNAWKYQKHIKPSDTVLDFGAGNGELLRALKAGRKIAVEVNPVAREYVKEQGELEVLCDLHSVQSESIDVVISNHCLEHIPSPAQALQEIFRVLRPKGKVVLCLPLDDWRSQRVYDPEDINHHLYTWTPQLIGNLMSDAGFTLTHTRIITLAWPPKFWLFYRYLPRFLFDAICYVWSVLMKRRELLVLGDKNE